MNINRTYFSKVTGIILLLFSFEGRISRSTWWRAFGVTILAAILVGLLYSSIGDNTAVGRKIPAAFFVVVVLLASWVNLALGAKRWHDMNRTAWLVLIALIPYVQFITFFFYGFVKGTVGPNKYGDDPQQKLGTAT